jgi:hypothetical protein
LENNFSLWHGSLHPFEKKFHTGGYFPGGCPITEVIDTDENHNNLSERKKEKKGLIQNG